MIDEPLKKHEQKISKEAARCQFLATEIVKTLVQAGYVAYFAGGWVRDYLLGTVSEDIDIATDAPPEKILDLFPNTLLIGLSFGIVIVLVKGHQFEVATFRRDIDYIDGRKPTSIELATAQEDASRRDFTINGMFYDPLEERIYDYVHGQEDLKHRVIRTIGDPYARFNEDRLRMIRAFRFAARFGFLIDLDTQEAIRGNAYNLFPAVAMERIWSEFSKMSKYPHFSNALIDMHRLEVLQVIFPALKEVHLNDIKHRVAAIDISPTTPEAIWCVMELFPEASIQEARDLCFYLRTSNSECHLAVNYITLRLALIQENDLATWTDLYAHPRFQDALNLLSGHYHLDDRKQLLEVHAKRIETLKLHIERYVQKKPLVNAAILKEHGILPGREMGMLLKEAERLTIMCDYDTADAVLKTLKESQIWKECKKCVV